MRKEIILIRLMWQPDKNKNDVVATAFVTFSPKTYHEEKIEGDVNVFIMNIYRDHMVKL